ncbi:MAG: methyltransferase domain-containing protein [Candidatus Sumerlaeia bacterium]|nr:methyltransferase domain-containing protein [Candidatus Sumerlaeia bacterium]
MPNKEEIEKRIEALLRRQDNGETSDSPLWENEPSPRQESPTHKWEALLQEMGEYRDPLALPSNAPLRVLKKLLGLAARPGLRRQSHFNGLFLKLASNMIGEIESLRDENRKLGKFLMAEESALESSLREKIQQEHDVTRDSISNLEGEIESLRQGVREKGNQKDVEKLYTEVATLSRAIEKRAAYEDFIRLEKLAEEMREALNAKGAQQDVEKLYGELDKAFRGLNDRLGLNEGEKLWNRISELEGLLSASREELRRQDARMLGIAEAQAVLRDNLAEAPSPPLASAPTQPPEATPQPAVNTGDDLLAEAYLRFQREFRGEVEDIRQRQQRYIDLLIGRYPGRGDLTVVDLACGDGIFVDLLQKQGWNALGVDLNTSMVRAAINAGLPVEQGDALAWLETHERESVDVLTGFQFIEHLQPTDLARLLRGARRVLRPGGTLILETIYPRTVRALQWYFLDLSHARLVFPEMLGLLAETAGLRVVNWEGIHPVEEHLLLKVENMPAESRRNFTQLNEFLYGPQDYYLVAEKSG